MGRVMHRANVSGCFLVGLAAASLPVAAAFVSPGPAPLNEPAQVSHLRGAASLLHQASSDPENTGHHTISRWLRASLAALSMLVALPAALQPVQAAPNEIQVYFGQGCFWHVQHEIIGQEVQQLGRKQEEWTALTGYAGGEKAGGGNKVCYHNLAMAPDYGQLGFTEVVQVSIPESKLQDFAKAYIDEASSSRAGRHDPQDRGTEYRSAIGIPGGIDGPLFQQVEAANQGRLQLVTGKGGDPDTVYTKKVWVYDSTKFPFYQGEVYHQFHDDMSDKYSKAYHSAKPILTKSGLIHEVGCPEFGF